MWRNQAYRRKKNLHLFVLVLYKIRNPHCRHRTGSPPLITLRAPQSPHLYSTPLKMGADEVVVATVPLGVWLPGCVLIVFAVFWLDLFVLWGYTIVKLRSTTQLPRRDEVPETAGHVHGCDKNSSGCGHGLVFQMTLSDSWFLNKFVTHEMIGGFGFRNSHFDMHETETRIAAVIIFSIGPVSCSYIFSRILIIALLKANRSWKRQCRLAVITKSELRK